MVRVYLFIFFGDAASNASKLELETFQDACGKQQICSFCCRLFLVYTDVGQSRRHFAPGCWMCLIATSPQSKSKYFASFWMMTEFTVDFGAGFLVITTSVTKRETAE